MPQQFSRVQSIFIAIGVTVIWSFSWVLIKFGLNDNIPPLLFAALRYSIASLFLLMMVLRSKTERSQLMTIGKSELIRLIPLGLIYYAATQGLQFLALDYLPAATYSLLLNFTSIAVMFGGVLFLSEIPTRLQIGAMLIFIAGVSLYFFPTPEISMIGLVVGIASVFSNAGSSLLGRAINRDAKRSALLVTTVTMGIGSGVLLIVALFLEGWQAISLTGWGIIVWLALVHTAFAFTLWNLTLQKLSATESSLINSTMLIQTAMLAWIFLGESLSAKEVIALIVALAGIIVFQMRSRSKQASS